MFKNSISLKKVPPPRAGVTLCNGYITVIYQTELMMPASEALHISCAGGEKKVLVILPSCFGNNLLWLMAHCGPVAYN